MTEETEFGICRLAIVPVRKSAGNSSDQVNQLLFGEHYQVLEVSGDQQWILIRMATDLTEGWIDTGHHHAIASDYFDQINHADFKITTDITATILYKKSAITILLGSIVPIATSELFKMEEQLAFNGETKGLAQKRDGDFMKSIAMKYINAPFIRGGKSPFGIDAFGFIQMIHRISGHMIPREPDQLEKQGKPIASLEHAHCGDIAFFESGKNKTRHCGLILEEDKIIHAHGRVRLDHLNEEGILNAETRIYTHYLKSIRRVGGD